MNEVDNQKDYYVHHLAEVNKSNRVLTISDIRNAKGALIVAKGTPITAEISQKIVKHKLLEPLESCVSLERSITPDHLLDELNKIIEGQENKQVLQQESLLQLLHAGCETLSKYPLLVQKFTVMQSRFPRLYKKTMGSSFIALIIAWQMDLSDKDRQHIFIAALMRDIGLLHIDPSLVKKRGELTADEWRTLQGHVAIGKVFLDLVPALPKKVGRAVLEHHERSDGSGYPYAKVGDTLCVEGQVLAMADTVTGVYEKQVMFRSYTLAAVTPILQINMQLYPKKVYRAIMATLLLMAGPLCRRHKDEEIPQLCRSLLIRLKQLALWQEEAEAFGAECYELLAAEKSFTLMAIAERIRDTIVSSGLLSSDNFSWLESVAEKISGEEFLEVEQQILMINELEWHCQQWHSRLASCLQESSNTDWNKRHKEIGEILTGQDHSRLVA